MNIVDFLNEKLQIHGSATKVAEEVGLSPTQISNARRGIISKKTERLLQSHYGVEFEEPPKSSYKEKIPISQLKEVIQKMEGVGMKEASLSDLCDFKDFLIRIVVLGTSLYFGYKIFF